MRHIPYQNQLILSSTLDVLFQICLPKASWSGLLNDLLTGFGGEFFEDGGERGGGCEDWCSVGDDVDDVCEGGFGGAVFLEEG